MIKKKNSILETKKNVIITNDETLNLLKDIKQSLEDVKNNDFIIENY